MGTPSGPTMVGSGSSGEATTLHASRRTPRPGAGGRRGYNAVKKAPTAAAAGPGAAACCAPLKCAILPVREGRASPSTSRRWRLTFGDAMGPALVHLVPLALAAALSSVPITATIFVLLSESRTRCGLAFLAGTVLGTFAVLTVATVAGQALPGRPRQHEVLVEALEVMFGIVMVLVGVVTLTHRTRAGGGRVPGWLDGIGSVGTVPVFGIGL